MKLKTIFTDPNRKIIPDEKYDTFSEDEIGFVSLFCSESILGAREVWADRRGCCTRNHRHEVAQPPPRALADVAVASSAAEMKTKID